MPLRSLVPPKTLTDELKSRVGEMGAERQLLVGDDLGGNAPLSLAMAAPHPVFNLALDAIGRPNWLSALRMTGWRYLVMSNEEVIAAAEALAPTFDTTKSQGTLTNEGPFVAGTEEALSFSEQRDEVAKEPYAWALIRIPALHVLALWLRHESRVDSRDWIVPTSPTPSPLQPNVLMRPDAFMQELIRLKGMRTEGGGGSDVTN